MRKTWLAAGAAVMFAASVAGYAYHDDLAWRGPYPVAVHAESRFASEQPWLVAVERAPSRDGYVGLLQLSAGSREVYFLARTHALSSWRDLVPVAEVLGVDDLGQRPRVYLARTGPSSLVLVAVFQDAGYTRVALIRSQDGASWTRPMFVDSDATLLARYWPGALAASGDQIRLVTVHRRPTREEVARLADSAGELRLWSIDAERGQTRMLGTHALDRTEHMEAAALLDDRGRWLFIVDRARADDAALSLEGETWQRRPLAFEWEAATRALLVLDRAEGEPGLGVVDEAGARLEWRALQLDPAQPGIRLGRAEPIFVGRQLMHLDSWYHADYLSVDTGAGPAILGTGGENMGCERASCHYFVRAFDWRALMHGVVLFAWLAIAAVLVVLLVARWPDRLPRPWRDRAAQPAEARAANMAELAMPRHVLLVTSALGVLAYFSLPIGVLDGTALTLRELAGHARFHGSLPWIGAGFTVPLLLAIWARVRHGTGRWHGVLAGACLAYVVYHLRWGLEGGVGAVLMLLVGIAGLGAALAMALIPELVGADTDVPPRPE